MIISSKANFELDDQELELLALAAEKNATGRDYRSRQYASLAARLREKKQEFQLAHAIAFNERYGTGAHL